MHYTDLIGVLVVAVDILCVLIAATLLIRTVRRLLH